MVGGIRRSANEDGGTRNCLIDVRSCLRNSNSGRRFAEVLRAILKPSLKPHSPTPSPTTYHPNPLLEMYENHLSKSV